MDKVKELLTNHNINIEDLKTHEYKDALHIISVTKDTSKVNKYKILVFPTQETFINTLNYLVNKEEKEENKNLVAKSLKVSNVTELNKLIPNTPITETSMILKLADTKENFWYHLIK